MFERKDILGATAVSLLAATVACSSPGPNNDPSQAPHVSNPTIEVDPTLLPATSEPTSTPFPDDIEATLESLFPKAVVGGVEDNQNVLDTVDGQNTSRTVAKNSEVAVIGRSGGRLCIYGEFTGIHAENYQDVAMGVGWIYESQLVLPEGLDFEDIAEIKPEECVIPEAGDN